MNTEQLQAVWDRQEIEQLAYRYARALDRMDRELLRSCYWGDATEEHQDPLYGQMLYDGSGQAFVPVAMEGLRAIKATQHFVSNMIIDLEGETATAEAYVWAYHIADVDGEEQEGVFGGRNLFRFEKRDGEWRIKHRSTTFDWNQSHKSTVHFSDQFADKYRGKRHPEDDSYNYIGRCSNGSESLENN